MSYWPRRQQHAEVNIDAISPYAICDRCGTLMNHDNLSFQPVLAGTAEVPTGLLVCPECYDILNYQQYALRIPPDPIPIPNPRPPSWVQQEDQNSSNNEDVNPWPTDNSNGG